MSGPPGSIDTDEGRAVLRGRPFSSKGLGRAARASVAFAAPMLTAGQTLPSAVPLEPSAKWVVDYADGMCVLSRRFGEGGQAIDLGIRPTPTQNRAELVLLTAGTGGRPRSGRGAWSLDDRADVAAGYGSYPMTKSGLRITTIAVEDDLPGAMKTAAVLSTVTDRGRLSFRLRSVGAALDALATCEDDLLRRWGVDPAPFRTLLTPATPLGGVARWFGPDAYPVEAIRAYAQGRVIALVAVDAAGKPTGCRVSQSAGNADLDQATCRIALFKARFAPARDPRNQPVTSTYILTVHWVMPIG